MVSNFCNRPGFYSRGDGRRVFGCRWCPSEHIHDAKIGRRQRAGITGPRAAWTKRVLRVRGIADLIPISPVKAVIGSRRSRRVILESGVNAFAVGREISVLPIGAAGEIALTGSRKSKEIHG